MATSTTKAHEDLARNPDQLVPKAVPLDQDISHGSSSGSKSIGEIDFADYVTFLEGKHVTPLWTVMDKMVPPRPNPKATLTLWDYDFMKPSLVKASEIVSAEEAERRVLVLVNQSMSAPNTTDTIYAGLQIVLPGETASAHRHRAFALRFIIEGSEGFTAVEGAKIKMSKGDVVLTPSWQWHDHGNEGFDPVIWLDALDLPLWQFLPINILERYAEPRYPSTPTTESDIRIPWDTVAKELDMSEEPHAKFHYKRSDGTHLSKTISAQAERISVGHTTSVNQDIFSYVYHVYQGHGFSWIKGPNDKYAKKVEWKEKDTFAIAAWSEVSHTCSSSSETAYLFAVNDMPIVEALTFVTPGSQSSEA